MSDTAPVDRMSGALARIEAAAQRIEAAKPTLSLPFSEYTHGDGELQAKYDALQAEASTALTQIEHILGTLEKDGAP